MKTVYVNKEALNETVAYLNDDITFFGFLSNTKEFLKALLTDPLSADINDYLTRHKVSKDNLLKDLLGYNIIKKETKIVNDNGKDTFTVKYLIPKQNFERKMKRLYSSMFEQNEIQGSIISEDCACSGCDGGCADGSAGATNASSSGQYVKPLFGVQRRKIYVTEEQCQILREMGLQDAGNYQYDVPMNFNNGDDPAFDHSNMLSKSFPKKKGVRRKKL